MPILKTITLILLVIMVSSCSGSNLKRCDDEGPKMHKSEQAAQ
jgi:CRISPR/Cas system-associated endonuclease Cas3-HD